MKRLVVLRSLEITEEADQKHFFRDGLVFTDNRLANLIRKQMHKVHGDWRLGPDDLADVRKLTLGCEEITDLADLRHFPKLGIQVDFQQPVVFLKQVAH